MWINRIFLFLVCYIFGIINIYKVKEIKSRSCSDVFVSCHGLEFPASSKSFTQRISFWLLLPQHWRSFLLHLFSHKKIDFSIISRVCRLAQISSAQQSKPGLGQCHAKQLYSCCWNKPVGILPWLWGSKFAEESDEGGRQVFLLYVPRCSIPGAYPVDWTLVMHTRHSTHDSF